MFKKLVTDLTKAQIDELERLGVARPRISEWRKGKGLPSRKAVLLLAQVTGENPISIEAEIMLLEAAPEQRDFFRKLLTTAGAEITTVFLILQMVFLGVAPENAQANQSVIKLDRAYTTNNMEVAKYTSWKVNGTC